MSSQRSIVKHAVVSVDIHITKHCSDWQSTSLHHKIASFLTLTTDSLVRSKLTASLWCRKRAITNSYLVVIVYCLNPLLLPSPDGDKWPEVEISFLHKICMGTYIIIAERICRLQSRSQCSVYGDCNDHPTVWKWVMAVSGSETQSCLLVFCDFYFLALCCSVFGVIWNDTGDPKMQMGFFFFFQLVVMHQINYPMKWTTGMSLNRINAFLSLDRFSTLIPHFSLNSSSS